MFLLSCVFVRALKAPIGPKGPLWGQGALRAPLEIGRRFAPPSGPLGPSARKLRGCLAAHGPEVDSNRALFKASLLGVALRAAGLILAHKEMAEKLRHCFLPQ